MTKANYFIHPVLLSIFPTLALYAHNINESWPIITLFPIIYSLVLALLSWLFFYLLLKNIEKTSIMTSIWLILFFSFGHVYLYISELNFIKKLPLSSNKILLTTYLFTIAFSFIILLRRKKRLNTVSKFLNVIAIAIVLTNLISIIPFEYRRFVSLIKLLQYKNENKLQLTATNKNINSYPDIYYLIFDRYGNNHILKKYLDYDNKQFLSFLEEKNFYIADRSYANYPFTFLSLSSSLNMEYLDYLYDIFGRNNMDQAALYSVLLENNNTISFLKKSGYRYLHFGDRWTGTKINRLADENYNKYIKFDLFELFLYESTLLNTVYGKIFSKQVFSGTANLSKIPENLDYKIEKLKEIIPSAGPKFVFGHFLLPHRPFLVSKECQPLDLEIVRRRSNEEAYIEQLKCANKEMKMLVEEIRAKSKRPTVIILQSDEGPYVPEIYFEKENFPKKTNNESYNIHARILNAFYLPETQNKGTVDYRKLNINTAITPVNTFRMIFNHYFGTNLKILENKSYIFKERKNPYELIDITDKLN